MSEPLHWSKKSHDYSTGVTFGVMFFVVFGLVLDDLVLGVAIGVLFFIAFSGFPEKLEAHFDGQTLRLVEDGESTELPAESIESVVLTDGDFVVRTKAGEAHVLEADDEELRAFVEKLRDAL
ncbi:hypothetical protein [Corynebacterium sp. HMSC071B10]|uniref:hypothetical protein n=1 Tax=Corynebacterium sp. HMSC071B10 TaxID=1739494 RepID=UPI0008A29458|nr:hypothetical protein [Corynebacterium sp. HMSC071B10]OFP36713.1 hypothetical protein HMPREF2990_04840 [Corynebacterium sp. HMSC071B10]